MKATRSKVTLTPRAHEALKEAQDRLGVSRLDVALGAFIERSLDLLEPEGDRAVQSAIYSGLPAVMEALEDEG